MSHYQKYQSPHSFEIVAQKTDELLISIASLVKHNVLVDVYGAELTQTLVMVEWQAFRIILMKSDESGLKNRDSLFSCTLESLKAKVVDVILCGLTLTPTLKQAAISRYGKEAKLEIMVAGVKHLLFTHGVVKTIDYDVVYQNDKRKFQKPITAQTIKDNFLFEKEIGGNRGKKIGAYCLMTLSNGEYVFDVMTIEDLYKRKNVAKTHMIWDAWEDEMLVKTVVLHAAKSVPTFAKTAYLNAVEYDNTNLELSQPQIEQPKTKELRAFTDEQIKKSKNHLAEFDLNFKQSDTLEMLAANLSEYRKIMGEVIPEHSQKLKETYKSVQSDLMTLNQTPNA
jgi:recombinational DNA repair protein RecT